MSDTQTPTPAPVVAPVAPKKKLPWKVIWEVILVIAGIVSVAILGKNLFQPAPQKDFVPTNDPNKVVTDQGVVVQLPNTQAQGQVTAKQAESVVSTPAQVLTAEGGTIDETRANLRPAPAVPNSAGAELFGPDGSGSTGS
jgi:hypothetical protein